MHDATIPKLLTVKQAAELLQVSTKTIYRWLRANLLGYVRVGYEYRIKRDSLPECPAAKENF
jgi:excisionase family DNA binding protein